MTHHLLLQKIQNSMEWSTSRCDCADRLHRCRHRGECRLIFDDAFRKGNKGNKSVSNISVMKREVLTTETMFQHLEGKKNWCYNAMVVSMTTPAHLITLLSANDSKLAMCWLLGPYIQQRNGNTVESSVNNKEVLACIESSNWVLSAEQRKVWWKNIHWWVVWKGPRTTRWYDQLSTCVCIGLTCPPQS